MRTLLTLAAAVAAAALLAAPVLTQPPGGPFGGGMRGGAGMLLGNSGVQQELKLDKDQKEKVTEFLKKQREKMQGLFQPGGDREKFQEAMKEAAAETDKFIKDTLKPEQQKRLKQIQRQQAGVAAFSDEDVQKALKLTDEQKDDIKKVAEETQKNVQELFQGGDREKFRENMQKARAMNKEAAEKVVKMLTPEQQKAWKEMIGEPYEVKFEGFGGGGRPPGRGEGGKKE